MERCANGGWLIWLAFRLCITMIWIRFLDSSIDEGSVNISGKYLMSPEICPDFGLKRAFPLTFD